MKTITLNKKRAGQDWKEAFDYLTNDLAEAKKQFTEGVRNDLSNDESFIYIDDNIYENLKPSHNLLDIIDYKSPGYYRIDGTGTEELLDNELIDNFSDDVYSWVLTK